MEKDEIIAEALDTEKQNKPKRTYTKKAKTIETESSEETRLPEDNSAQELNNTLPLTQDYSNLSVSEILKRQPPAEVKEISNVFVKVTPDGVPVGKRNTFERNDKGLLTSVNYIYKEDGSIDYRAMIPREYLVVNKQNFERRKADIPDAINGLKDKDLLILLTGIKYIAKIRGYTEVKYPVVRSSPEHCTVTCEIKWISNFEECGREVISSGLGDATPFNTTSFAQYFLGPMAQNRAFVRCVKDYLNINILGQDEISDEDPSKKNQRAQNSINTTEILVDLLKAKGKDFESVKSRLTKQGFKNVETYQTIEELPKELVFHAIEELNKLKNKE